jgi:hypothetical protein
MRLYLPKCSAIMILAALLVVACDDRTDDVSAPPYDPSSLFYTEEHVPDAVRISDQLPEYGGFWYRDGIMHVGVTRPVATNAALAALRTVRERDVQLGRAPVLLHTVRYTEAQLREWQGSFLKQALPPGFVSIWEDTPNNTIVVDVDRAAVLEGMTGAALIAAIPSDAIRFQVAGPGRPLQGTIRENSRPYVAGLSISSDPEDEYCTMGPLVKRSGDPITIYFLTNSHCGRSAADMGVVDPDLSFWQPNGPNHVGFEAYDPPPETRNHELFADLGVPPQ